MEKNMVCPCGLTCCDCLFYKPEIYAAAQVLHKTITENGLDTFLNLCSRQNAWEAMGEHLDMTPQEVKEKHSKRFGPFSRMPIFMEVLQDIIQLQCKIPCQEGGGCSVGGETHSCKALNCLRDKGYSGCWQCSERTGCANLKFLVQGYGEVIAENLETMATAGYEGVRSRGNRYYAWQRKMAGDSSK